MSSVVQEWMSGDNISWKQQTVILTALRGCDSFSNQLMEKIKKKLRNTVLKNAGASNQSFMSEGMSLDDVYKFTQDCDKAPNHYHMHVLHAFEIIGYKHPDFEIREWFMSAYSIMVDSMHVRPETEKQCDARLADAPNLNQ